MNNTKRVSIANFNTVFLKSNDEEAPLLEYFDTIIMPALQSGITRKQGDNAYLIIDVNIVEKDDDHILTGYLVKKTVLERFSDLDSNGNLITMDDRYSAAPFSYFSIFLKNHRMIFVENQKGSPRLGNFRSTIKYIIDTYVKEKNRELSENNDEQLPIPLVNVIGIPPRKNIENELKDVAKINKLTLRFFPLNGDGDINLSGVFSSLSKEVRAYIGSKTGEVSYSSPQNIQGVINLLAETEGTADPILKVTRSNNAKQTIRSEQITERMDININGKTLKEELDHAVIEGSKIDSIKLVSQENQTIYQKNKNKIIPFVRK